MLFRASAQAVWTRRYAVDSALSISFSTAALLAQRSAHPRPLNTSIRRPGQHGHQSAPVPRAGRGRPLANRAADHKSDATPGRGSYDTAPRRASHNGAPDRNAAADRESDAASGRRTDDGSALSTTDDCPADRQSHAAPGRAPNDGEANSEGVAAALKSADDAAPHDQGDGQADGSSSGAPDAAAGGDAEADGERNHQTDAQTPADARPDFITDGPLRRRPPDRCDDTTGRQAVARRQCCSCTQVWTN